MKITRNGDQGSLAKIAQNLNGQAPDIEGQSPSAKGKASSEEENSGLLEKTIRPSGRDFEIKDNDSIVVVIANAGKALGYDCKYDTVEKTDGTNSSYTIFMEKTIQRKSPGGTASPSDNKVVIRFHLPSFGNVTGAMESGPDWIDPETKLAMIRDIMRTATKGGEIAALPMKQRIDLGIITEKKMGVREQVNKPGIPAGGSND